MKHKVSSPVSILEKGLDILQTPTSSVSGSFPGNSVLCGEEGVILGAIRERIAWFLAAVLGSKSPGILQRNPLSLCMFISI